MAVDYFLKIDGVEGESTDAKYKNTIMVDSFSWGETQASAVMTGGGAGAGKVNMQDFHFTTQYSKASPKLFLACATGQHIKQAQLLCRKAGGKQEVFLTVTLTDCIVSSYQTGGSSMGDIVPTDQVSLAFAKLELEYKEQKTDGTTGSPIKAGYDIKSNTKV